MHYYFIHECKYKDIDKSKWKSIVCLTEKVVEDVIRDIEKNKKSREDDKKIIEGYKKKIKAIKRKRADKDKALAKKCKF